MKYQKKSFLVLALAGIVTVLMAGQCGGGDTDTNTDTNPDTNPQGKQVKVKTWSKVPKAAFGGDDASFVASSEDKSRVYVVTGANKVMHSLDASDAKNATVQAKWEPVTLTMAAGAAGKALLTADPANVVTKLVPAKDGVFVTIDGANGNDEKGAWYIKGKTMTAGWASKGADIANGAVANGHAVIGFVAKNAAKEDVPLILDKAGATGALPTLVTFAAPDKLAKILTRGTNAFNFANPVAAAMGTDFYIVDANGINVVTAAALIDNNDFATAAVATIPAERKVTAFGTVAAVGAANDTPAVAYFSNGKLYIGFTATATPTKGGVAVYSEAVAGGAGASTAAPVAAWKGVSVLGFAEGLGKVWAVTKDALIEVKSTATEVSMGDTLNAKAVTDGAAVTAIGTEKDGYAGTMPSKDIVGAAFGKNDVLVVATSTDGVHVMVPGTETSK